MRVRLINLSHHDHDQVLEANPCVEYVKYIVFPWFNKFEVARSEANGGNKAYTTLEEFEADYKSGALHPSECHAAL